ncbi:unnamed protein product [Ambrosiozyma monospora]|uniref:NADH-ubiquinone oxidoreductase n=1 Tax=Ambrosiozyma monospora TaxID=43982 RepID=A0A9W6Z2G1_AMBMO|nr:unnamed protein product [Ambrosiozyma monospora]
MSTSNTYDTISTSNATDKRRDTHYVFENGKLPEEIPHVKEIGATTGPLLSASYFIGNRCRDYNDNFMLCHAENGSNGPINCLKEGRQVTRCAASVISDLNKSCKKEFELHFKCLNYSNMEFKNCRKAETLLNDCVFNNLKLIKEIPDDGGREVFKPGNQIFRPIHPHRPSEDAFKLAQAQKDNA